ncbi:PadR family transcriptional regulator [Lentilactobacillus kefiri]|uniref:Transcriptional regulator n=3 Tax=Lentilactobacillus kefiri TaxID=33962 RepID=A0A511DTV0_LENKE|nr:PadR family transcriptional regulator [Lentilactobacillus kefiri]MCJ2161311.1 PadR family transcriptional regulator [Lentilactobacillus kefiri]MDH5108872.1 PadR family transcriptional regulator [Lentilactobacillus kefiri]MDM7492488.1 PadR family transcriptional regulator [Lentilactobacillus kefiri]PAK59434.1 PadR family transcriptional regulator [Lentilactobacillus kefiri]PAK83632.1 PadR family transcriptional regulator [Lentilactobacillus kefiri]
MAKQDLSSQMLKGILQGCLLMLISDEPMYGYSISQALTQFGFQDVPKGTVYPLLINMEKKGLITGKMQPSKEGPKRKYYYITANGVQEKKQFINQWHTLSSSVNSLIHKRSEDDESR